MNLMTMQFGSFVFPVNPTELKLERACLLRETVGVDGEERVEAVGKRKARIAGKGERFIFGLQTMLGTGKIAVKGAKV